MHLPPLGLYIHLPWCERKCPYCDFNSHELKELPEEQYVTALLADLRADLPLIQERTIETLFIGGGTPSLFSAGAIARLLGEIATTVGLSPTIEASMEANPGSAEAEKFSAFRAAGINRLSLGIQSFDDSMLEALGRVHNSDQAHAAVEYTRKAGFDSFNLDLMHGLPGQSAPSAVADLRTAINCNPHHLSWYQLTIEPNTSFHKRPPPLPLEEELADIQGRGENLLAEAGYHQYEVSAYSKPGLNCRHNHNYWSFGDYLGIGAGAHGKITHPDGRIERYSKHRQPDQYLRVAGEHRGNSRVLDSTDLVAEFVMNALRLNDGFSFALFCSRTGLQADTLQPTLGSLVARGLLEVSGDQIRTTDVGRRFLDTVVAEFFPD